MKRPACNAVADRRMLNLRPSCVSYAAGVRRRPARSAGRRTPTVMSRGRSAGRTPARVSRLLKRPSGEQGSIPGPPLAAGKRASLRGDRWESKAQSFRSTPLGGCSESKARSYATGPGFGGLESSRFLGRETLEKPDNDLSITPHLSVGKGFGASPAKVFDPVQFSSEKLQFSSDKVW